MDPSPRKRRREATPAGLQLAGVSKRWGEGRAVLDRLDLDVGPGQVVRVRGANGGGKTTLLRIAAGLILPDRGSVELDGLDPESSRREFQGRVGFLAAGSTGLYGRLTATEHLDYWSRMSMMPRAGRRRSIEASVDAFGFREHCDRRVDRLSLGQRQRVRLAMTFLHRPHLALLDEPASSLDPDGLEVLFSALASLRERNGLAIWCAPVGERSDFAFDSDYELESARLLVR